MENIYLPNPVVIEQIRFIQGQEKTGLGDEDWGLRTED